MPGPFDYSNGISRLQHKLASWYGLNVRRHLAIRFGVDEKDVLFLNDADAFLLGELQGSFAPKAVGITLGTAIQVPTLVLAGDDDQIVPYKDGAELQAKLLKKSTLKIYPGYAHGMLTTHADILNADIFEFIRN